MGSAFILFYGFWLIFFFKVPAFDKAFYIKNSLFTFVGFLALSHTISYVLNYLIMEEYKEIFVSKIYSNFYLLRMLPMHFAIMIGILVGIPAIPLILIKTVVDLALHIKEHKAKRWLFLFLLNFIIYKCFLNELIWSSAASYECNIHFRNS